MELGKLGVWCRADGLSSAALAVFARKLEQWGYGALWQPDSFGRDVLLASSWVLGNTERLVAASGIASIYARDSQASFAAQQGLNEQSGGRFLLGLGVSHAPVVDGMRGHHYGKPIAAMSAFLEAMKRSRYLAVPPENPPLTVLAALGPRMLVLSAAMADGAHTFNVTPEHTAEARKRLGAGKLLCVEQKVLLETDEARARHACRTHLRGYLGLGNYQENWRRLGFTEADWAAQGSDRLIDAMVAWGDEQAIRARLQLHWAAGASHVCVQPLSTRAPGVIDEAVLALLAPTPPHD
jgi:probable F420-dependent oxidoreductase